MGLALASPTAAATRITPPVHSDVDRVGCVVQNRGKGTRTVTAILRDATGAELSTYSLATPPGLAVERVFTSSFQRSVLPPGGS